jgi:inosine-uridine nucleoside N-ribohydrolase
LFRSPDHGARGRTRRVWIDSDLAVGSPWREVDDGYALLLAARSPGLRIAGISSSYGNASLPITAARTRESLGLALAVSPGARSAADLGLATEATRGLKAALRQNKLTYIALGPLTNLATFIQLHPGLATRIDQIIMVAGESTSADLAFGPAKIFRMHDANVRKAVNAVIGLDTEFEPRRRQHGVEDPNAVRAILRTRIPILLAPIETSARLLVDRADLRAIAQRGPAGNYLAERSRFWFWFWTTIARKKGGPIFDALAIVAAVRPGLIMIEDGYAAVDADGKLIVRREAASGRAVQFCSNFAPATKTFVLKRLTAPRAKSAHAPRDR